MKNKNIENNADYQAYLERISAPPCPHKITDEELQQLKDKKNKSKAVLN